MKKWLFPFFFLLTIFATEIFCAFLGFMGMSAESGMLQRLFIPIAGISYLMLMKDLNASYAKKTISRFVMILLILIAAFFFTSMFYGGAQGSYLSSLLHFGSICMAACICGMHLGAEQCWEKIDRLLPFFLFPIGFILGTYGFSLITSNMLFHNDEVALNYQALSYYMAEIFAYSGYYVFFSSAKNTRLGRMFKYPLFGLMLFCAAVSISAGGRGAFLFLVAVAGLLMYMMYREGRMKKSTIILTVAVTGIAFVAVAGYMHIWESSGFDRITGQMFEDDSRDQLRQVAMASFEASPLFGHGIGAVWFEVGYASHNAIMDLLVDGGVIWFVIVLLSLYKAAKTLYKGIKFNPFFIFMLCLMAKVTVEFLVSGYYMNAINMWMILGFVYVYRRVGAIK